MATIICGSNQAYHTCDSIKGCNNVSKKYYYNSNVAEIDQWVRAEHWYVSFSDDTSYCQDHNPHIHNEMSNPK